MEEATFSAESRKKRILNCEESIIQRKQLFKRISREVVVKNTRTWIFLCILTASCRAESYAQHDGAMRSDTWEKEFRSLPRPENLRRTMQLLSAHPHHVGSVYDRHNAEWILSKFKEWGWDAHIETYDVLFPTPQERYLALIAPDTFTAKLQEPPLAVDSTSAQLDEQLPTYNAYSIDGDVTAPLVYVNYGLPEDYDRLDRMRVSVKG